MIMRTNALIGWHRLASIENAWSSDLGLGPIVVVNSSDVDLHAQTDHAKMSF